MQKVLTTSILSGVLAIGFSMQASTIEYTYAEGELFGYGQGMKENIDVAIRIDNPALAGMKIKNIKAYLSGTQGYGNTSVWLSETLNLENKVNVPDIASYSVDPVATPYGDGSIGLLSVDLTEPYELTREPLYVGYSLTVSDNSTQEAKYPIVVSEGSNPNGLFLHMSKSVLKWMDYSKKAGGVAYVVLTLEGDIHEYSLSLTGSKEANVMTGKDFKVEFEVNNTGFKPVADLKYSYSYDDDPTLTECYVTLPAPIEPDVIATLPLTLDFKGIDAIGPHTLKVRIDEVNGHPNESSAAYAETLVNVMPYAPTHRPLVEEFTGLWCGWCPRGWVGMEMLGEKFGGDVVVICYHNGDGMAVTNTYPVEFSGYPNASINRLGLVDPYYGSYNETYDFGIAYDVENSMAEMTFADIRVEATLEGSALTAVATAAFMKDIPEADYRIGYVLTSNGLSNPDWKQTNYYTGLGSEYAGTYLEELTRMPKYIPGLTFNDVAVDVSAMKGVEGSLPASIKTAEEYVHSYTFDLSDIVLISDPAKLVVNAFVVDNATGAILNSCKFAIPEDAGTDAVPEGVDVIRTEYFDLSGRETGRPDKGIVIKREHLSDGSVRITKQIN